MMKCPQHAGTCSESSWRFPPSLNQRWFCGRNGTATPCTEVLTAIWAQKIVKTTFWTLQLLSRAVTDQCFCLQGKLLTRAIIQLFMELTSAECARAKDSQNCMKSRQKHVERLPLSSPRGGVVSVVTLQTIFFSPASFPSIFASLDQLESENKTSEMQLSLYSSACYFWFCICWIHVILLLDGWVAMKYTRK